MFGEAGRHCQNLLAKAEGGVKVPGPGRRLLESNLELRGPGFWILFTSVPTVSLSNILPPLSLLSLLSLLSFPCLASGLCSMTISGRKEGALNLRRLNK